MTSPVVVMALKDVVDSGISIEADDEESGKIVDPPPEPRSSAVGKSISRHMVHTHSHTYTHTRTNIHTHAQTYDYWMPHPV